MELRFCRGCSLGAVTVWGWAFLSQQPGTSALPQSPLCPLHTQNPQATAGATTGATAGATWPATQAHLGPEPLRTQIWDPEAPALANTISSALGKVFTLARYSDSREVPLSVLKCETVLGTLDARPLSR